MSATQHQQAVRPQQRADPPQQQQRAPKLQQREESPEREHFGWLSTSTMPAKKRRLIEGVSGRGVVELQAQLYRAQEAARLGAEGAADVRDKHVRRKAGIDVASIKNAGVEAREARDRALQLRTTGHGEERLAESAAALQRKAALYDRLAAQGGGACEEEDERYEVEFWRKGASHEEEEAWEAQRREREWLAGERERDGHGDAVDSSAAAVAGSGALMSEDMARERERREWEEREAALMQQQAEEDARREARRNAVRELSGQTKAGRSEAAIAKAVKAEQLATKRARLKAAFISQQVAAIKAKKQQAGPGKQQGGAKPAG